MWKKLSQLKEKFANKPLLTILTDEFGGRHTFFVFWFSGSAFLLAWYGKLTDSYAAVITALQVVVLAHSAKEDYFQNKNSNGSPQCPTSVVSSS